MPPGAESGSAVMPAWPGCMGSPSRRAPSGPATAVSKGHGAWVPCPGGRSQGGRESHPRGNQVSKAKWREVTHMPEGERPRKHGPPDEEKGELVGRVSRLGGGSGDRASSPQLGSCADKPGGQHVNVPTSIRELRKPRGLLGSWSPCGVRSTDSYLRGPRGPRHQLHSGAGV